MIVEHEVLSLNKPSLNLVPRKDWGQCMGQTGLLCINKQANRKCADSKGQGRKTVSAT